MKKFVNGLFFGGFLGGLLALFLAPASGEKTREKLKAELEDANVSTQELEQSLKNFQKSLWELKETITHLWEPFKAETTQMLRDFEFQATPRINQIQASAEKLVADLPKQPSNSSKKFVRYYLPPRNQ